MALNLQSISLQYILDALRFTINESNEEVFNKFLLEYLLEKPTVIQNYLDQRGLFNVFYRTRDPHDIPNSYSDIQLLKSFVKYNDAVEWIREYGENIVAEEEDNYGTPIVLTIIYYDNKAYYAMDEIPANMNLISINKYPTFAFSDEAYRMLIEEHIKELVEYDNQTEVIPYWITYYREDGSIIRGFTEQDFMNLPDYIKYNNEIIEQFKAFQKNPIKYALSRITV